jgi:starch synthase
MNILFTSSEIYPYAKTGGLADVAQSLPEALRKTETVYTVMPLYNMIDRKKFNIVDSGLSFEYWLCGVRHQFDIFVNKNIKEDIFIYNPILCDREGLYHDSYGDFGDNGLRFGLFAYAVLETMIRMKLKIDVIHVNDWQTSLISLLVKTKYKLPQKVILTIHNLAYQGIFPKSIMDVLELDWDICFKPESFEHHDGVNFLKAGIFYSDEVTTVSPTYKDEIQTKLFGNDLDKTLRDNNYKLTGILNGISYEIFDPKTDTMVYKNFDIKSYKNKFENKKKVLDSFGLFGYERPLFIFIGRFTNQKGIDLLIQSFEFMKDFEINMIILGSGEKHYDKIFEQLQGRYHNIHIEIGYDESLARKLYAAADFLLMPSIFEPCGLNQMISMKYGTIPIVAKTGGLKDSVIDFSDVPFFEDFEGIGITFEEKNSFWFMHALTKAISLYAFHPKFVQISKHNMKVDYSWSKSAKKYIELYSK